MLNLGELGSNYLPSIHFVPKLRLSSFQKKLSNFDGKEDFKRKFKEDQRFEEAPSIKNSRTEENRTTHGHAAGVHGRAPQAERPQVGTPARTAVHWWRTTVLTGTAVPCTGRVRLPFFGVLFGFGLDFRDLSLDLFGEQFLG